MKEIGNGTKSINLRTVGIAIGGGAVLILVAAQLLAKSSDAAKATPPSTPAAVSSTVAGSAYSADSPAKTTTGVAVAAAGNIPDAAGNSADAASAGNTPDTAGSKADAAGTGKSADAVSTGKSADTADKSTDTTSAVSSADAAAKSTDAGKSADAAAKIPPPAAGAAKSADAAGTAHPATPGHSSLVPEPPLRELFRPLVVKDAPKPPAPLALTKLPALKPGPRLPPVKTVAAAAPAEVAPAGPSVRDIQMLGVVEADSGAKALLKKTTTGESRYFAKGEDVFGFTLQEIKADAVTLALNGKTETVAMSTAIPVEGSGSSAVASTSPFASRFSGGPGGAPGFQRGDRGNRGDRSNRGNRGDAGGGGAPAEPVSASANTALTILSSTGTWKEKLSKLEAAKASIDPAKYDGYHKLFAEKAAAEGK